MRVRWPAARVETPTTWTSASRACVATSAGVWKSGPTSTSNPRSANPDAITFWPRSWPSWPILATRMRGRLPASFANSSTAARVLRISSFSPNSDAYAPPTTDVLLLWRPKISAITSDISPSVQRTSAQATHSSRRFLLLWAASLSEESALATAPSSRVDLTLAIFASCVLRTASLSMMRALTSSGVSSLNLFTPTTTSMPASRRACLRAAHSSMRSLGMPDSTALAMPPIASTSLMMSRAWS
mmetsp:Transcript_2207/g.5140  ORF Transcript_2207/g.5140 Transcript_2207/m.5140 type:complete len:243 (+) Transcript_2207:515-1243(+)